MKKNFLLLTVALLCAVVQGAWAQTEVGTEAALTEVINGDGSNKSVKMTADISLGSRLNIVNGKNVTLDLNGHKLSRSLADLTSSLVRYFYLPHDGTYGFKGVSEDLTGDAG